MPGKLGRNGLGQPIAGHAAEWELALCATVLSEGHAPSKWDGDSDGAGSLPLACWLTERAEGRSHSVKFIGEAR